MRCTIGLPQVGHGWSVTTGAWRPSSPSPGLVYLHSGYPEQPTNLLPITVIVILSGLFIAWRVRRRGPQAASSVGGDKRLAVTNDRAGWIVFGLLATMVILAWTISKLSGVWVPRYFAVFVGPFLVWAGWAFARAGVIGVAGLLILGIGFQFYPHTPEQMAARLPELLEAGVRMVGGCCGTTPGHIAAFRAVVDAWNARRAQ